MKFQGTVQLGAHAGGSKSAHAAVVLMTQAGPLKLRRPGGNPFRDPVLDDLVGHEIVCQGDLHAGQLFMKSWQLVPDDESRAAQQSDR